MTAARLCTTVALRAALTANVAMSGAAIAADIPAPPAGAIELRLAHFVESRHPMHREVMVPWSEALAARTNGRLRVRVFPAGELGRDPAGQLRRVRENAVDIVWGLPGYTPDAFPRTLLASLPGVAPNALEGTRMLWRAYGAHLATEFADVKLLALWTNEAAILLTRDRLTALSALRGRVVRHPTVVGRELVLGWGATPATSRIELAAEALAQGRIDAAFMDAGAMTAFGVERSGRHALTDFASVVGVFFLVMNRARFEALPADLRAAIDATTGPTLSCVGARAYYRQGIEAARSLAAAGLDIARAEGALGAALEDAARAVRETTIEGFEKGGIAARATLEAMRAQSRIEGCD